MKVLHIYKDYFPVLGGIENHVGALAREQQRRGLDVTVLVTGAQRHSSEERDEGVRVIRAGRLATVASTPISLSLFRWVRRLDVDVTHLHFPYPVGELAWLACGRSRATVLTYHSDVVRQRMLLRLYEPLLWRTLRAVDRILATNAPYIESSRFLREVRDRTMVVPLGIPLARFAAVPADAVAAVRERFGRSPDGTPRPLVLSVGRLRYYKGLDTAIAAMRELPGARLLVVGSGPMAGEWQALAADLGLGERVCFAGEVDDADLPSYFAAADLYVSSASHRSEAFGISILEAMASGLPVISTELGTGTSFVNLDGMTGHVVPPRDPPALAGALRELLASPDLRRRMGRAARERVEREFTLAVMTDRVIAVYEEVLSKG